MLRFGFNQFGGPEVFTTIEAPIPQPHDGRSKSAFWVLASTLTMLLCVQALPLRTGP